MADRACPPLGRSVTDGAAHMTDRGLRWATAGAWVVAVVLMVVLGAVRYAAALAEPQPDFVNCFIFAAREVAAGRTPYSVNGYYYSPLVALMLAPVAWSDWAAEAWTCLLYTSRCV